MSEWKPIKTAPRDGTPILVWHRGDFHVARWLPLWTEDNKTWLVRHPAWTDDNTRIASEIEPNEHQRLIGLTGPSHWMPIPDPPK